MPSEEIIKILQSLGFTNYEIKILLELYTNGPSQADELAKYADIPLARSYDALDNLKRKDFVSVSQGRPRVYTAENPQEAVSSLIEKEKLRYNEQISSFSEIASSFLDHAQRLYFKKHTLINSKELLSQFSSLKEAEVSTREMVQSATKSIDIFTHVFNWFDDIEDDLIAATKRGCRVRVILKDEQSNINLAKLKSIGIDFKLIDKERVKTRGTIVDDIKVIFVIWATEGVRGEKRIFRPQFSYNEGIVEVFSHFFEFLWRSS